MERLKMHFECPRCGKHQETNNYTAKQNPDIYDAVSVHFPDFHLAIGRRGTFYLCDVCEHELQEWMIAKGMPP